jgi:hypothetical protein
MPIGKRMPEAAFDYAPRNPEATVLYQVVARVETFLTQQQQRDRPVPPFIEREFRSLLDWPAHGRHGGVSGGARTPNRPGPAVGLIAAIRLALPLGLRRAPHQRCPERFHSRPIWRIAAPRSGGAGPWLFAVWRRYLRAALWGRPQCQPSFPLLSIGRRLYCR